MSERSIDNFKSCKKDEKLYPKLRQSKVVLHKLKPSEIEKWLIDSKHNVLKETDNYTEKSERPLKKIKIKEVNKGSYPNNFDQPQIEEGLKEAQVKEKLATDTSSVLQNITGSQARNFIKQNPSNGASSDSQNIELSIRNLNKTTGLSRPEKKSEFSIPRVFKGRQNHRKVDLTLDRQTFPPHVRTLSVKNIAFSLPMLPHNQIWIMQRLSLKSPKTLIHCTVGGVRFIHNSLIIGLIQTASSSKDVLVRNLPIRPWPVKVLIHPLIKSHFFLAAKNHSSRSKKVVQIDLSED